MLNVIYALIATEADGGVDRAKVRAELDRVLEELPDRIRPDVETWGTSARAQAGMAAAEAMFR